MHGSVTHMLLSLEVWTAARHARLWHAVTSTPLATASRAPLRHLATASTLCLHPCHHASACSRATQLLGSAHQAHQPTLVTRAALLAVQHYTTAQRANSTMGASTLNKPRRASPILTDEPRRGGWTSGDVLNTANLLSLSRLLSGPGIAALIVHQQWHWALPCLAVAGLTDWLDGLAARWLPGSSPSVLGSYLDPLADKVLICCVVGALGWEGTLSLPLVAIVVARDAYLVAGATHYRMTQLRWRWPGWSEFFRIRPAPAGTQAAPVPPKVVPIPSSKMNTVCQLVLVSAAVSGSWLGAPSVEVVHALAALTVGTTAWSCVAYTQRYWAGTLFK